MLAGDLGGCCVLLICFNQSETRTPGLITTDPRGASLPGVIHSGRGGRRWRRGLGHAGGRAEQRFGPSPESGPQPRTVVAPTNPAGWSNHGLGVRIASERPAAFQRIPG